MKHPWICLLYLGILHVVTSDDLPIGEGGSAAASAPQSPAPAAAAAAAPTPAVATTTGATTTNASAPATDSKRYSWAVLTVNGMSNMYRVIDVPADIRALAIEKNFCSFLHPNAKPAAIHDEDLNKELTKLYENDAIGLYVPRNSDILKWQDGSVVDYFPMSNGTEGQFFDVNRPARYVVLGKNGWLPITTEELKSMLCEISSNGGYFSRIK